MTYVGDMRVVSSKNACRRWFITINGKECTLPSKIESINHPVGLTGLNYHRTGVVDGICKGISAGSLSIGLSVGKCTQKGYENYPGDAYTCWGSICRIIIEEFTIL